MQRKIVEFTNILRKAGIRVSVAESLDSFRALDEMSLDDRELFRDALRATMVKHWDDIPAYDRLFDLFWSGFHDVLRDELGQAIAGMGGELDLDQRRDVQLSIRLCDFAPAFFRGLDRGLIAAVRP